MIDDSSYKDILANGLLLDHYFLLCKIKKDEPLLQTKRVQGFYNLLVKKGYIEDGELTDKGIDMVVNSGLSDVIAVTETTTKKNVEFGVWAAELHKKCQDEIYRLTGLKQVRPRLMDKVSGRKKAYSFLCNATDLTNVLNRVVRAYKLTEFDKIEAAVMKHIKDCAHSGEWFPLVHYYIMKDGQSRMVTDMDSPDDTEAPGHKSSQKFI